YLTSRHGFHRCFKAPTGNAHNAVTQAVGKSAIWKFNRHSTSRTMTIETPGNTVSATSSLAGIRVLDISGSFGNYCGKLFADLGADVILVEPLNGTATR